MEVAGIVSDIGFDELSEHLHSKGADAALMDPRMVFGRSHVMSAAEHAERSFRNGTNRSKTFVTEFLMYMAGERQISKALERMRPKGRSIVAVLFSGDSSLLCGTGMRDDSLIAGTDEKAAAMGLDRNGTGTSYEDLALELVAMLDILKG